MKVRIGDFCRETESEGPGKRFAIWFQGCSIRCKGCIVPQFWDFDGGKLWEVEEFFSIIKDTAKENHIEGVTFLGGEPFDQKEAVAELAYLIKKEELNLITFTGYLYEDLIERDDHHINQILELTDVLIDGPYLEEKRTENLYLRGSSNQRIIILSARFSPADFNRKNSIEFRFGNGEVRIVGFPFEVLQWK